MRIVVDSYAWIELFIGSSKGKKVMERLLEADRVFTPGIVLAEIARKYHREGLEEEAIRERLRLIVEASEIIPIDEKVALESASCYEELLCRADERRIGKPSLFDAIILATARMREAKVLTGDEHFKDLPETLWLD